MNNRVSADQLTVTLNEQSLAHRVNLAKVEGATVESLLAGAALWEERAGNDGLYSLDPEACLQFARENRETAVVLQALLTSEHPSKS